MGLKAVRLNLPDYIGNDLLDDASINNLMQEVTSKLISDFYEKRNKIITERLKEIVGIDLDIKSEVNRRFKRCKEHSKRRIKNNIVRNWRLHGWSYK